MSQVRILPGVLSSGHRGRYSSVRVVFLWELPREGFSQVRRIDVTGRRMILGIAAVAAMMFSTSGIAQAETPTKIMTLEGFQAPGTPEQYNKVKVIKQGPDNAKKILVLIPGTSAGASNFTPLGEGLLQRLNKGKGSKWAIWSIERRENLLEDHSYLEKYIKGKINSEQMTDYYLRYITDPSISPHFEPKTSEETAFARNWGMNVAVQDVRKVVNRANQHNRKVVLGGHSLGGSITTAYATWDFNGKAGAKGLDGLVFIDGAGAREPEDLPTAEDAQDTLDRLAASPSPFITLVPPFPWIAGVFNATGSTAAVQDPNGLSTIRDWPVFPDNLTPPAPVTNAGQYGYGTDASTSPASLALVQSHFGHLATSGNPRKWVDGELGTVRRAARVFAEKNGMDGTSWYHPARLSADAGSINNGIANPAQSVFGVKATMGKYVDLPMYSFDTSLGDGRVAKATWRLAEQSHVPASEVRTVQKVGTYGHIDPLSALPKKNAFIKTVVPFLKEQVK